MTPPTCARTEPIRSAFAQRPLDAGERAHLRVCDDCAAALASAASGEIARGLAATARLPSARQTLLRARLEARRRETERRLRPLAIWQSIALGVAGLVALRLAPAVVAGLATAPASSPTPASPAQALFALGLGLLGALAFGVVRRRTA